eukprot:344487-Prymnesium_polylepis.1
MTGRTGTYQGARTHEYTCCTSGSNTGEECGDYRAPTAATSPPPPPPPSPPPPSCDVSRCTSPGAN